MANNKFFKNTYITGEGRTNYLSVRNSRSYLEDPLFTSFTFDMDYITSPLFYTIKDYSKYVNIESLAKEIERSLEDMHGKYMNSDGDSGYDILPLYSAEMVEGKKLGFGLQQNVYMDLPLYGATEYIYMVDKRNGNDDQNDVRYDNNNGNKTQNVKNSYKLGDSVKSVVNESDKAWAENKAKASEEQVLKCEATKNDENVKLQHETNRTNLETAKNELNITQSVDGVEGEFTEEDLENKVNELKGFDEKVEKLKKDIISWVNGELQKYQNKITDLYKTSNTCVKYILAYEKDVTKYEEFEKVLKEKFTNNYESMYLYGGNNTFLDTVLEHGNKLCTFSYETNGGTKDDGESLLLDTTSGDSMTGVRQEKIIEKFKDILIELKLYDVDTKKLKFDVKVLYTKQLPDWAHKVYKNITWAVSQFHRKIADYGLGKAILTFMKFEVSEASFMNFDSDTITQNSRELGKYEKALDEIKTAKYGYENGSPCDKDNPSPDSKYAKMLEAQEAFDNDEYSQASKMLEVAKSENSEMSNMLKEYNNTSTASESIDSTVPSQNQQKSSNSNSKPASAPRTVLDMIGFISGMKKMTNDYPYIIQGITGLDTAYNKHYGIKDPYLGSGEDKITLTCLESIDLRVSSMFNRYFNAVYDRQYRRERVPVNLRRFNCSVYVHDVRNFASKSSGIENRITELSDMYYGVIEFKFYDCEIVPEETGNIFNDISNEAPSEMKKTNFTFTYGNCVVNFVPSDGISRYGSRLEKN